MIFMVIGANAQEKKNSRKSESPSDGKPSVSLPRPLNYSYEFSKPEFTVSKVTIKHGPDGHGTISFVRSDSEVTEPIVVSIAALDRINSALGALDFARSSENYQYEKDYSHLGTAVFGFWDGSNGRTVSINYTENPRMRAILDEYRKIGQQAVWVFDIKLARDNQPLEAPGLVDSLDSYLKRGEISDPSQLMPFLKELTLDERLPLIARNKVGRLIKRIEEMK